MNTTIRTYNLCLLGFGNVNRTLARLLEKKRRDLAELGIAWKITGLASRRMGWIADVAGVRLDSLPSENRQPAGFAPEQVTQWLKDARCDVLMEATSLDPFSGQPAIAYLRAALEFGAHAISANKGPVVHAFEELEALANTKGRRYLFESAVMDGVPIFSLFRENLPAVELRGFHGVLNSTTNVILSGMEEGLSFEDSLRRAQEIGVAETDARHDIDGWDAAVKVAALVRVLMRAPLSLSDIQRDGIGNLTAEQVRRARTEGKPYKLVCRAQRNAGGVTASVRPEQIPLSDPMAWVAGTSSIITFETDIFPSLVITENRPGVEETAYGLLAGFVRAVRQ